MKEILGILFQERKVTLLKVFLAILLTGLFISAASEFYYYIRNEMKLMADKTKISIVLNDNTEDSEIKSIIRKLQRNPKINTIEYISSEQAEFEFFKAHPAFSKELLTVNPFPPLINFTLLENHFNLKEIRKISKILQKNKNIIEIKYKKDFLAIFLSVKQNLFSYFYFISSLILIMIIVIQYFAIRFNYFNLPEKVINKMVLGDEETKPLTITKYKFSVTIFIFVLILLSIFISSLLIFTLWWFLKDNVIWIGVMSIRRLLTGLFITGGLMLYISIFTAMIMRKKV